jgi:hypothetical protein
LNPSYALRLDTNPTIALTEAATRHRTTAFLHRHFVNRFPIASYFPVKTLRLL